MPLRCPKTWPTQLRAAAFAFLLLALLQCGAGDDASTVGSDIGNESARATRKPWLTIGIPTMPRSSGADYLTPVAEALRRQVAAIGAADPLYGMVTILIANMRPGLRHEPYERLRDRFEADPVGRMYFQFDGVDSAASYRDDRPGKADAGTADIPGHRVRRQTRDIAALVDRAEGYVASIVVFLVWLNPPRSLSSYFMFAEDDFMLCPNGLVALQYVVSKATRLNPHWSGIRVSFGLAGWIFKDGDLRSLSAFMVRHQWRRPPDHLATEFAMGTHADAKSYLDSSHAGAGSRLHMAFRHNLLLHIGVESVLGHDDSAEAPHYPLCFQELREPPLWRDEAFQYDVCWDDDLSPCFFRVMAEREQQGEYGAEASHRITDWLWSCAPTLYPDRLPPLSFAVEAALRSYPGFWAAVLLGAAIAGFGAYYARRRARHIQRVGTCPHCKQGKPKSM